MKLQIKTLNQKCLSIDIAEDRSVYDLKQQLEQCPDVGVRPEFQRVIYAGKILLNEDTLSKYNIDEEKYMVVIALKRPEQELVASSSKSSGAVAAEPKTGRAAAEANVELKTTSTSKAATAVTAATAPIAATVPTTTLQPATPVAAQGGSNNELIQNIVSMGYPEAEVRRALEASFYIPERAIEYLTEGIPAHANMDGPSYTGSTMPPIEVFRSDPLFRNLRHTIQQHPELLTDVLQRVVEANPALLQLITENQEEFLTMLLDASDSEEEEN